MDLRAILKDQIFTRDLLSTISVQLGNGKDGRKTKRTLIDEIVDTLNSKRINLIRGLTQQAIQQNDRTGYVSSIYPEENKRSARKRTGIEKELHYQSCYIYFYLKSQGIHPNEVQMMCAKILGKTRYFLAVNSRDGDNSIEKVRDTMGVNDKNIINLNLKDNLQNIKNEYNKQEPRKQKRGITRILEKKKVSFLRLTNVEFTTLNQYPGRHAEEFLCDRAIECKEQYPTAEFFIYGKRRPCITCKVKMETASIANFNENHGRLFLNTIIKDGRYRLTPAEMHRVINILLTGPSNITSRGDDTTTHYPSDEDEDKNI